MSENLQKQTQQNNWLLWNSVQLCDNYVLFSECILYVAVYNTPFTWEDIIYAQT